MPFNKPRFLCIPLSLFIFLVIQHPVHANKTSTVPTINILVDSLPGDCAKKPEIEKIIGDAIALGAPIYNEGLHMACYRIYEWAGYKILYEYGKSCKDVEKILKTAIDRSHGDFSDMEKAWLMRAAFDKILGVPTQTGAPENSSVPRKG